MLPLSIVFLLVFVSFVRQKVEIIQNIKADEDLQNEFFETVYLNSPDTELDLSRIDQVLDLAIEKESVNDFLTIYNFGGKPTTDVPRLPTHIRGVS